MRLSIGPRALTPATSSIPRSPARGSPSRFSARPTYSPRPLKPGRCACRGWRRGFGKLWTRDKFVRTLKGAGFNEKQAEALTDAVRESQAFSEVATKSDLRELELRIEAKFANVDGELKFLKWILGFIAAGVASLVLKAFF